MKVALIGATGRVGSHLLAELLARDHVVTGIVHTAAPIEPTPTLSIAIADARDASALAPALVGHDAVISASRFVSSDANALISALKQARVGRLMAVGGAGSLEVAPGQALADSPGFPEAFRAEAEAGRAFLAVLRAEPTLDWTCLSPSADFAPGMRTGHFRLGHDTLLVDSTGRSWISMEDYAMAFVDELERPNHSRARFTVGY
jgi:putative NADH-flavin reductase